MKLKSGLIYLICLCLISCSTARKSLIEPPSELPPPRIIKNVDVALVLGGGGAKGIAHLGVIEVLEKNNIPIDLIVGTSAGAIVGAMYADYKDSKLLKQSLFEVSKDDLLDFSLTDTLYFFTDLSAPIQGFYLEDYLVKNLTVNNMEELKIPFIAVTSDLDNEQSVGISSGPIATAVHASAAIPPYFRPVKAYNKLLVDGGVMEPVPVITASGYKPKVIISVDISTPGREFNQRNMWDVTLRSMYVSYFMLSQYQASKADVMIHPDCTGFGMFDDDNKLEVYKRGRLAAETAMPKILEVLKSRGVKIKNKQFRP